MTMELDSYSLDEMVDIAYEVDNWEYSPMLGSFCGFRGYTQDYRIDIAHFDRPRGISKIEESDTWYNKVRNKVLNTVPLLGMKDTVYIQIAEYTDEGLELKGSEFGEEPELIDLMIKSYDREIEKDDMWSGRYPYLKDRIEKEKK